MSLQSTVGVAKTGTHSLRATIPEGVVAYLGVHPGDKLEWRMEVIAGEKVVLMRKAGSSDVWGVIETWIRKQRAKR